jgi:hypothetical protein
MSSGGLAEQSRGRLLLRACLEVVLIFRDTLQTLPKVWMSLARPLGIRSEECKKVAQR